MPPPRSCWPAQPLMRLREVGYPPHQDGLAFWNDWRDSCSYFALIPSVTERSALFVRNCRSHRRCQLLMPFFNQNWARACRDRWARTGTVAGSVRWLWTLDSSAKIRKKVGRRGLRPLPLRCLSQFLPERKDRLLRGRMFCVPFTDGVAWYL